MDSLSEVCHVILRQLKFIMDSFVGFLSKQKHKTETKSVNYKSLIISLSQDPSKIWQNISKLIQHFENTVKS